MIITNHWKKKGKLFLIAEYVPENIFKVDEIGLSLKFFPEKRSALLSDKYNGEKRAKRS